MTNRELIYRLKRQPLAAPAMMPKPGDRGDDLVPVRSVAFDPRLGAVVLSEAPPAKEEAPCPPKTK